jgi:hypothetical protein
MGHGDAGTLYRIVNEIRTRPEGAADCEGVIAAQRKETASASLIIQVFIS